MQILECIKQLSQDPYTLEYLQRAEAMKHLVPLLAARDGPYVNQIHNQVFSSASTLTVIPCSPAFLLEMGSNNSLDLFGMRSSRFRPSLFDLC